MIKTKKFFHLFLAGLIVAVITSTASIAIAIPTFQTFADGAIASTITPDEETWFIATNPFTLYVVGAYDPNTISLTGVTLLISALEGETGTISITPLSGDEAPILLTTAGSSSSGAAEVNPTRDADTNILTNVAGNDGYATIETNTFLPFNVNSHYPLHDNVSNFLIYDLFAFGNGECGLNDYNADGGSITPTSACGEQKEYTVSFSGFSSLHFDAYGLETDTQGRRYIRTTWEISPGSHDTTAVPEPSTILLVGSGLAGLGLWRRMRKDRVVGYRG